MPFTVADAETAAGNLVVTATSSNTTLVPNANIQLNCSGAARTIKVTPVTGKSGAATIDLKVSDGAAEAHETFEVAVLQVNQVPTAVNDSYSVGVTRTLTVAAGTGVLKNDTDADSSGLQA